MTAQPYQPPARQPLRSRCSRWRIRRRAGRGLVEPLDDRLDHRRSAQIRAPAPMALGMSTEERGIEHGLGERLRVSATAGSRPAARPWDGGGLSAQKKGPPSDPSLRREFGRLSSVKLARTTSDPALRFDECDETLGRDTLLACEAQSVDPTTSINSARRHNLDDSG
jgi:hypothetical protein